MNNIALSGGGGNGLAYFRLWKEIDKKDIRFDTFTGSSAGVVMGNLIMSGMTPEQGKELLKKIQGDKYLDYNKKIKEAKWYKKPFMLLFWVFILRRRFFKSCKILLKNYFNEWNSVNVRCKKALYSFVLKKDVIKFFGKKIFKEIREKGIRNVSKEFDIDPVKILEAIPVYYNSDNGVYKYDFKKDGLYKVSNNVTPPWKAVLMAFNNPLFPLVKIRFGLWWYDTFDGGLVDNYACMAHLNTYRSVACITYVYNTASGLCLEKNKPERENYLKPLKDYGLLEFTDKNIEKEYERKSSNIFKGK